MMSLFFPRCGLLMSTVELSSRKSKYFTRGLTYYSVKDIFVSKDPGGNKAEVKGWVKAVRKMKDNIFIDLDDGSCPSKLQVVIPKEVVPEDLTFGCSIEASGQLVNHEHNKVELVPDEVKVVGPCVVTDGFPFHPRKSYPPDYVRQFIHFRPRTRQFSSLLRVRHGATQALHKYFSDSGFFKIDVPVLTGNDCEGAGEVFFVKPDSEHIIKDMASPGVSPEEVFFNSKTYLTVSGQFHLEVVSRALGKVYCLGPTFRAENSKSRLHLSEFYMAEAELAFTQSLGDVLSVTEGLVKSMVQYLMDSCGEDLHSYLKVNETGMSLEALNQLLQSQFTVDSYDGVCDILDAHKSQFSHPAVRGQPLSKEHELFLVKHNNNVPVFVVDWPAAIKPFYMKTHADNPAKVHAVDLLCPNVGELCGGSLREDSFDLLQSKIKAANLEDKLSWYLELRKFGNVPTGGFGMGFERFLQVVLGILNIKDTIPFPRWPHNCKL